jgi:hypothetical protein
MNSSNLNLFRKPRSVFSSFVYSNSFSGSGYIPLLVLIPLACFAPTFFNDFQYGWDDWWMLIESPFVGNTSLFELEYHFTHFYRGQYSPINTLFYTVIHSIFGMNALAFHTACLLVHILNVLLVFYLLRIILLNAKPAWPLKRIEMLAFLTALFFALHPLQVELVAWISASKVLLYAFFTLLGIWFYIRYIKSQKVGWLIPVGLCYLLGFGSKEQAIIFPLLLFAFDYVFMRFQRPPCACSVAGYGAGARLPRALKLLMKSRVLLEKIPFFLIALFLWYFSTQNNLGVMDKPNALPFDQRMLIGAHSFMEYIFRFLAPVKLYYMYYLPIKPGEELPLIYWFYPFLLLIVIYFIGIYV